MPTFDLVFEGGGAKGSVFVGALEAFYAGAHRHRRLVGTSAGAITATLLAAQFTTDEMLEAINEQVDGVPRFSMFMDTPSVAELEPQVKLFLQADGHYGFRDLAFEKALNVVLRHSSEFRKLFAFSQFGGLYSGLAFVSWLGEKLKQKQLDGGLTLKQLFDTTGRHLTLVATDVTESQLLVLNHLTAPGVPVVWAARMSMSIPFVWGEVTWKEEWGLYDDQVKTGNTVVDGGLLSNFPIDLVACNDDRTKRLMGPVPDDDDHVGVLGLLIDEDLDVEDVTIADEEHHKSSSLRRVQRLMDTMRKGHDNALIGQYANSICRLPAKGYGTTEFGMPEKKLKCLVDAGRKAMDAFLKGR
jgi:NTE family protein